MKYLIKMLTCAISTLASHPRKLLILLTYVFPLSAYAMSEIPNINRLESSNI